MILRAVTLLLLAMLATGCGAGDPVDVNRPDSFSRQAVLQPASSGRLQRLTLPPAIMLASQRRDLGDIRLFDARGRLVSLALLGPVKDDSARPTVDLPVYPVTSDGDAERPQDARLSVRLENGGVIEAITMERPNSGGGVMPAALLDTRKLEGPIDAIALRMQVPAGRTVPVTLLSSTDLRSWTPLAEKVLFRPSNGGEMLGGDQVTLDEADLRGRFIAISWAGLRDVSLDRASAILAGAVRTERVAVPTAPLATNNPHELMLRLPDNARLTALRVTSAPADGVVPIRLLARSPGRDAWTLVASATLSPEQGATTIDLPAGPLGALKLEADRRTGGFSEAPLVELMLDPLELLVGLSGTPPYRLAVGQAAAAPNFLSQAEVAPALSRAAIAALPRATLAGADEAAAAVDVQPKGRNGPEDRRKLLLWAALLLGTLVLAFAAIRLLRDGSRAEPSSKETPAP